MSFDISKASPIEIWFMRCLGAAMAIFVVGFVCWRIYVLIKTSVSVFVHNKRIMRERRVRVEIQLADLNENIEASQNQSPYDQPPYNPSWVEEGSEILPDPAPVLPTRAPAPWMMDTSPEGLDRLWASVRVPSNNQDLLL